MKVFRRRRPEERWIIFIFARRRENERLGLDGRRRVGQAGRQFPPSSDTTIFSPAYARRCRRRPPTQQPASTILHARSPAPRLPATRLAEARRIAREMLACRRKVTDPCNAAHSTDFLHAVKPPFCTEGSEYEEMTF